MAPDIYATHAQEDEVAEISTDLVSYEDDSVQAEIESGLIQKVQIDLAILDPSNPSFPDQFHQLRNDFHDLVSLDKMLTRRFVL